LNLGRIEEYLSSLSQRERRIILIGFPIVLVALYLAVVFTPILGATESYQKKRRELLKKEKLMKTQIEKLLELRSQLEPVLEKVKRGTELDVTSYVKTVARMVGAQVRRVKLLEGTVQKGIEVDTVSVEFSEQPLDRITRMIFKLENSRYYFKSDGVKISDYDENGLVSGKVTLYFFRRAK